jgi:hypothetical protein
MAELSGEEKAIEQQRRRVNALGDEISWRTLESVQSKVFVSREQMLARSIFWCSGINVTELVRILNGKDF